MDSKSYHDDQDTLSFYGVPIVQYHGQGVLTLKNSQTRNCSFVAGQLTTGEVLLLCTFPSKYPPLLTISANKFEGTTVEGFHLFIGGSVTEISYLPDIPAGQDGTWATFQVREMHVQIRESSGVKRTHFGVTNLDIGPTSFPSSGFGPLSLNNGNYMTELWVRPIKDYRRKMRRLRTLKVTDVTCEITRENSNNEDIPQLTEVVNNLCYLLSVARGTKIQYIYCDQYDETDRLIYRSHYSRLTKAYCPLTLIQSDDWKSTKVFIESAYPVYAAKCEAYRLNRGTIDAYLDAKAEHDHLEMRGAKLAVALEILRDAFLKLLDPESVIDVEQFNGLIPVIQRSIGDVLQSAEIEKSLVDVICSKEKILQLNRRSFGSILRRLCKEIDLNAEKDINLFIACRNSLIHKGDFYCNTATEDDRRKCEPLPSGVHEFFFLTNFLDRVFLKLFTYTGKYINWRSPGNPNMEQL